jgi:hypothetical protein
MAPTPHPREHQATPPALSIEQGKELVSLCRTGRLYEVDAWIAAGKSLTVSVEIKKTPLQVAVGQGFHSLVKLLAMSA